MFAATAASAPKVPRAQLNPLFCSGSVRILARSRRHCIPHRSQDWWQCRLSQPGRREVWELNGQHGTDSNGSALEESKTNAVSFGSVPSGLLSL
jgi:hypothetical protein